MTATAAPTRRSLSGKRIPAAPAQSDRERQENALALGMQAIADRIAKARDAKVEPERTGDYYAQDFPTLDRKVLTVPDGDGNRYSRRIAARAQARRIAKGKREQRRDLIRAQRTTTAPMSGSERVKVLRLMRERGLA